LQLLESKLAARAAGSTKQITEDMVMAKRDIFGELVEGVAAMKSHREGKLTLRSYKVEVAPLPKVDSKLIRDTRKRLRCSRAVFARKLRINERTLEKWEQGRAKLEPSGSCSGSSRAEIPGYPRSAGGSGRGLDQRAAVAKDRFERAVDVLRSPCDEIESHDMQRFTLCTRDTGLLQSARHGSGPSGVGPSQVDEHP
jgi:putative transcriptional regulator